MLTFTGNARIFLCQEFIDLRKGFEALSGLVERLFGEDVTSGAYFAFLNRDRDRIKVLYWDADGLVIWYKRLEKCRFAKTQGGEIMIDRREFLMLLEGVTPRTLQKRFKI